MSAPHNKGRGAAILWLHDHVSCDSDCCLIWPFARVRGYGNVSFEGKLYYAHRVMCELANGPPPTPDHQAAHSCGKGDEGCVHPKHLSWKTQSGNQLDRRQHGTTNASNGWTGKLSWQQVEEIRALKGKKTQAEIALIYGIGRRNVGAIHSGRSRQNEIQTEDRRRVIAVLELTKRPMRALEVLDMAQLTSLSAAYSMLAGMTDAGQIERTGRGLYALCEGQGDREK